MATMLDYLTWRGDLAFNERPFNEVDNLILSELAYAPFEGIVPGPDANESITLSEVAAQYCALGRKANVINDPGPLLASAGQCARFADVRLDGFINHVDPARQVQFSAVCFALTDGSVYVAYRGTDNSIVGWREDFQFAFTETEGQAEAAAYLSRAGRAHEGIIRVGGHSKGGNLAIYAAANCDKAIRQRIDCVYSNDGPGFNRRIAQTEAFKAILGRTKLIIPESSIVGILLENKKERRIVKSSASGAMQHNPLTWQVLGSAFVGAKSQSPASLYMDETLDRWLDALGDDERRNLVSVLFDALDASGASTFTEIKKNKWSAYGAILSALAAIEPGRRQRMLATLWKLATSGSEVLRENSRAAFEQWLDKLTKGPGEQA